MAAESALEFWRPIRETIRENQANPNELVFDLLACLSSPNSELRDSIAYEMLTYWLRNEALSEESRISVLQLLSLNLSKRGVSNSLERSFSALVLSELLRSDNLDAFMSDALRSELLVEVVDALDEESDYRGLVQGLGWIHPIAHMADVLWRFSLHGELTAEQTRLVLQAVRSKAGTRQAAYAFNEGDRLARPVAVIVARQALPDTELIQWLDSFGSPQSSASWFDSFSSPEGMLELHNSKLFVRALADQLIGVEMGDGLRAKIDELVALFTSLV
ncbi:MAG: hypothetical protein DHS20C12_11570 [Pseudohongiella sp.]|nr:MAG: hypothetical protein DHS20C12_11570 [Pseudohongiella sp.]